QESLGLRAEVAGDPGHAAARLRRAEARKRVVVEIARLERNGIRRLFRAEQFEDLSMVAATFDHGSERREQDRLGPAVARSGLLPDPVLVDERVPEVEDDRYSHDSRSSRSAGSVTFRSRRSPSTTRTRPPCASTRPAQSDLATDCCKVEKASRRTL